MCQIITMKCFFQYYVIFVLNNNKPFCGVYVELSEFLQYHMECYTSHNERVHVQQDMSEHINICTTRFVCAQVHRFSSPVDSHFETVAHVMQRSRLVKSWEI